MTQYGGCRLLHKFRKLCFLFFRASAFDSIDAAGFTQVLGRICRAPLGMNIKTRSDGKLARMWNGEIEKCKFKSFNVIWNMNCE